MHETIGDILICEVAGQQYGLPVSQVQEVLPRPSLVPLPCAPGSVLGLLRLRGSLLPVLDLNRRLGLEGTSRRLDQCIVVMIPDAGGVGLLVDAVRGIRPGHGAPSQAVTSEAGAPMFHRVALSSGEVVALLNVRAAIGSEVEAFLPMLALSGSSAAEDLGTSAPAGERA